MKQPQMRTLLSTATTLYFYAAQFEKMHEEMKRCWQDLAECIKIEEGSILDDDVSNLLALVREVGPLPLAALKLHERFEIYGTEGFEDYNEA